MPVNKKTIQWISALKEKVTPNFDECYQFLSPIFPLLTQFKDTPQDPEWHAEGDVYIHTSMVLDELYTLLKTEASHISGEKRQALILAVILHDITKPIKTKEMEINGILRIVAPRHEDSGRSYICYPLLDLGLSFTVIWNILHLVGAHQIPKRLAIKNASASSYFHLSQYADLELLYWLEKADMRGRICPDLNKQILYLDEFKMFAQEYNLWGKAFSINEELKEFMSKTPVDAYRYVYAKALHGMCSGRISVVDEELAISYNFKKEYSHLVIMCAPSGAGKSTWIQNNYQGYKVLSLDDLREEINGDRSDQRNKGQILQLAKERLKISLRKKENIVWDATNLRKDFRSMIAQIGYDYHALIRIVFFMIPEKILRKQNNEREFSVTNNVLAKQMHGFEFPMLDEAHEISIVGESQKEIYFYPKY